MNVIRSNLFGIFLKRSDWMVWNFSLLRALIASGFISAARILFGDINFKDVFANMPEPVPMSRWDLTLLELKYFFKKSAKKYESSDG